VKLEPNIGEPLRGAVDQVTRVLDPVATLLYGSRATGRTTDSSDYDLAVLTGRMTGWEDVLALRADLEEQLRAPVDLVLLDEASPILAMQVLREGRLLACRDQQTLENFIVRTLSDYADLKVIRREAEKRLMEPRER
jgi:uncharacterized protein